MAIKWTKKDVINKVQEAMSGTESGKVPNILERLRSRLSMRGVPEGKPEVKPSLGRLVE